MTIKKKLEKREELCLNWIMSRSEENSVIKNLNPGTGGGKNKGELGIITGNTLKSQFLQQYDLLRKLFISLTSSRFNFSVCLFSVFFF